MMTRNEILVLFPPETLPSGRIDTMLGFWLEIEPQNYLFELKTVKGK
jgi:hypothetical protein